MNSCHRHMAPREEWNAFPMQKWVHTICITPKMSKHWALTLPGKRTNSPFRNMAHLIMAMIGRKSDRDSGKPLVSPIAYSIACENLSQRFGGSAMD